MEYIDKREYKEFTVDMYYGKDNRVKAIIPRERVEIRAGEINKGLPEKFSSQFLKTVGLFTRSNRLYLYPIVL